MRPALECSWWVDDKPSVTALEKIDFPSLNSYRAIAWLGVGLCVLCLLPHSGFCLHWVCAGHAHATTVPVSSIHCPYCLRETPFLAVTHYFQLLQPVSVLYPGGEDSDTDIPFRAECSEVSHSECSMSVSSFWYFLFQVPKAGLAVSRVPSDPLSRPMNTGNAHIQTELSSKKRCLWAVSYLSYICTLSSSESYEISKVIVTSKPLNCSLYRKLVQGPPWAHLECSSLETMVSSIIFW